MSGVMSTVSGQSSDRASIFVMGTMMGVAVAGAGALALSYYTRMERERFAADARERYARGSRRHSSEGIKDPSGTSAQRERMGRYRRSAGMIASAQVANMARQTSVDTLDSDIDQSHENNAEYIMATEADDLMRAFARGECWRDVPRDSAGAERSRRPACPPCPPCPARAIILCVCRL